MSAVELEFISGVFLFAIVADYLLRTAFTITPTMMERTPAPQKKYVIEDSGRNLKFARSGLDGSTQSLSARSKEVCDADNDSRSNDSDAEFDEGTRILLCIEIESESDYGSDCKDCEGIRTVKEDVRGKSIARLKAIGHTEDGKDDSDGNEDNLYDFSYFCVHCILS